MKRIYQLRYRRILFWLSLIILGIYLFSGFSAQRQWHLQRDYFYSSEFTYTPEMGQQYDSEGNLIGNINKTEFIKNSLDFYESEVPGQMITYPTVGESGLLKLMPVLVLLVGFLVFFLDQKTQFNRFLFSLPFSRKRIFSEKLRYVILPILAATAVGIFLYDLVLYTMIPQPYLNTSMVTLLLSGLSNWGTLMVIFALGSFLGISIGNALSGSVFVLLVCLVLTNTIQTFYQNTLWLLTGTYGSLEHWLVLYPSNQVMTFVGLMSNVLLIVLFLGCSYLVFHYISMEEEGNFLTVERARHWYFCGSMITSVAYLVMASAPWENDVYQATDWIALSIFLLAAPCILAGFIYFASIKRWIEQQQKQRYTKKFL